MKTRQEITKTFRWVKGHKMTVRDFMMTMEYSDDPAINNMFWSMKHAIETGRMPRWTKVGIDKFFTNKDGKIMTNVQARAAIVTAIMNQEENTTAAGVKAIQSAFGIRTV